MKAKIFISVALASLAPACATTVPLRMYSASELGRAGQACGLALGELAQEEEEPRLLFMIVPQAGRAKERCVRGWARRRSLHLVLFEGLQRVPDAPNE